MPMAMLYLTARTQEWKTLNLVDDFMSFVIDEKAPGIVTS